MGLLARRMFNYYDFQDKARYLDMNVFRDESKRHYVMVKIDKVNLRKNTVRFKYFNAGSPNILYMKNTPGVEVIEEGKDYNITEIVKKVVEGKFFNQIFITNPSKLKNWFL